MKRVLKRIVSVGIGVVVAHPILGVQAQTVIYPNKGQSSEQQSQDVYACRSSAEKDSKGDLGALGGAALGAVGGALTGNVLQGAAVGAGVGAASTAAGNSGGPAKGAIGGGAIGAIGGAITGNAGRGAAVGAGVGAASKALGGGDKEDNFKSCMEDRGYTIK